MIIEFPVTVKVTLNVRYSPEIEPIDIEGELNATADNIASDIQTLLNREYADEWQTLYINADNGPERIYFN